MLGFAAFAAANTMDAIVSSMRTEIRRIATQMPSGVMCGANPSQLDACLIRTMSTTGNFRTARHDPNQMSSVSYSKRVGRMDACLSAAGSLRCAGLPPSDSHSQSSHAQLANQWALPADVANRLRMLVISESVTFQSFSVVLNAPAGTGELTEYVGVARRYNGQAEVALAHVRASAALKQQHQQITTRACHGCWLFFTCCNDHTSIQARGFNSAEITRIADAMRSAAYTKVSQLIDQAPRSFSASLLATQSMEEHVLALPVLA